MSFTPDPEKSLEENFRAAIDQFSKGLMTERCRVCGGIGWVAHKQTIDDGDGEVDACASCDGLVSALEQFVDDTEARWDMTSPSTNPGIKHCVEQAKAALTAHKTGTHPTMSGTWKRSGIMTESIPWQIAREIAVVVSVESRLSEPNKQMINRLNEWRHRLLSLPRENDKEQKIAEAAEAQNRLLWAERVELIRKIEQLGSATMTPADEAHEMLCGKPIDKIWLPRIKRALDRGAIIWQFRGKAEFNASMSDGSGIVIYLQDEDFIP